MDFNNVIDDIMSQIQTEDVPFEYILMAKITDIHGMETIINGQEMADFIASTNRSGILDARVVLDLRRIRMAIISKITEFVNEVEYRLQDR